VPFLRKKGIFVNQQNIMGIISLDISAKVNQPPSASGWLVINLNYNSTYVFTLSDFTTGTTPPYSDPEGDDLQSIKITSLPLEGQILKGAVPIVANDVITYLELGNGDLSYVSDASDVNGYTDGYAEFLVSDQGSMNFTTSPKSITFKVFYDTNTVNEGPSSVGNGELTVGIGSTTVFTRAMLTTGLYAAYSDPEGDAALNLLIETVTFRGSLFLSGTLVVAGQVIPFSEIDLGNFTYVNYKLVDEGVIESFNFKISDAGSGEYVG